MILEPIQNHQVLNIEDGSVVDETYAPFLNRLEKYVLTLEQMLDKNSYREFLRLRKYMEGRISNFENPEILNKIDVLVHDYSVDLLASNFLANIGRESNSN